MDDKHSDAASQNSAKAQLAEYIRNRHGETRVSPQRAATQRRIVTPSDSGADDNEMTYRPKHYNF